MGIEKRRYPRVKVQGEIHRDIAGVTVEAVYFEKKDYQPLSLKVRDMSYNSIAFDKGDIELDLGDDIEVSVRIHGKKAFKMIGRAVRSNGIIAVLVESMEPEGRLLLEGFLKEKMIGANAYRIDPQFYNKKDGYDHWFHGPNDTNILLWVEDGLISQAYFEMDDVILLCKGGHIAAGDAFFVSGEAPSNYREYFQSVDRAPHPEKQVLIKALNIVSQIEDDSGILGSFRNLLRQHLDRA